MPTLTATFIQSAAKALFSTTNSYGLGTTSTSEVSVPGYSRASGSAFGWTYNSASTLAPVVTNASTVYYPEATSGYTAAYFHVYASTFGNTTKLVWSDAFQSAATVQSGQLVKIGNYVSGASRGIAVTIQEGA